MVLQVRPIRDGVPESRWAYYGSGFVEAVLKSELLELTFYGAQRCNFRRNSPAVFLRQPARPTLPVFWDVTSSAESQLLVALIASRTNRRCPAGGMRLHWGVEVCLEAPPNLSTGHSLPMPSTF